MHGDDILNIPIPVKNNNTFNQQLESVISPSDVTSQRKPQLNIIKLSQYSTNTAEVHYLAVKQLFKCVKATESEGIYFWWCNVHGDLPEGPLPITANSTYTIDDSVYCDNPTDIHSTVDSDWASDSTHWQSVSGIFIKFCGGTIYFKTKFQDMIAICNTEA